MRKGGKRLIPSRSFPYGSQKAGKSPSGKEDAIPCFNYLKGKCDKGANCDWWHPPECRFFKQGNCSAGKSCSFVHAKDKAAPAPSPEAKAKAKSKPKAEPKAQGKVCYLAMFLLLLLLLYKIVLILYLLLPNKFAIANMPKGRR